jgi:anti-sigma factor RsiW
MRAVALIEEHLDGRLSDALEVDLAAHLDRCDACRAELELADRIHREMSALPKFDTPPHVIAAARRRIDDNIETRLAPSWIGRRRPVWTAAVAAAVTALAVTAVLLVSGRPHQAPEPSPVEVAQATTDARLAFALIADATQRAEHELRDSVLRDRVLATAVRGISRSFRLRSQIGTSPSSEPTPTNHAGGST